jgi:hypothetical protein
MEDYVILILFIYQKLIAYKLTYWDHSWHEVIQFKFHKKYGILTVLFKIDFDNQKSTWPLVVSTDSWLRITFQKFDESRENDLKKLIERYIEHGAIALIDLLYIKENALHTS